MHEAGFWWLSFAFAVSTFSGVAITIHLIPYLVEVGYSPGFAATIAGLFGLMPLAGRLLIGPLGDRHARRLVAAGLMGMQLAGLAMLALAPIAVGALVFIALFGAGTGTMTIMRAALIAERYGPANYATISGAKTLAPLGASLLAMSPGGYSVLSGHDSGACSPKRLPDYALTE